MTQNKITSKEREGLEKLVRQRARVLKADVEHRKAELLAEAEAQLARKYDQYDAAWADAAKMADEAAEEVNAKVEAEMERRGVPKEFWPRGSFYWSSRGSNASKERRAELRRVAQMQAEEYAKRAKLAIENDVLERQTTLIAGLLETSEAKAFLDAMPKPEALMPHMELSDLEGILDRHLETTGQRSLSWPRS